MIGRLFRRDDLPAEVAAFQDPLDALMAEPAPRFLRLWPALAAGLILSLIGAAALLRVDMVVTAPGRLTADVPPVVLQPSAGAVLRALRVRPGDTVREGDVVAVLDSTFTQADRDSLDAQRRALAAQRDRLRAEIAGGGP
ncbi:MAG: biotin/lipoyl-binding protein, partial [Amaricoccus sp.]